MAIACFRPHASGLEILVKENISFLVHKYITLSEEFSSVLMLLYALLCNTIDLEQHGFDLCWSTYIWVFFFFSSRYTPQYCMIYLLVEASNVEPKTQRAKL